MHDAAFQMPPCQTRGYPSCHAPFQLLRVSEGYFGSWSGWLEDEVRASPSSASPRASHSSSTSHHLVFPDELTGSSDRAGPSISFGAQADDRLSIAASGDELGSGDDDSAALPPSGRVALPESDPELTAMLSQGRWERRAALKASAFSRALKAGRLVPGGAGRSPATASGSFLPGSAWGGD